MDFLRILTFPFALIFGLVVWIRNGLFNAGILASKKFDLPVILVGNLSMGGTGKSPHIEYLVKLLQKDHSIATLSRGYGRRSKGFLLANNTSTAEEMGDEPLQFSKKFPGLPVAVDANRTNGIDKLRRHVPQLEAILLDDAYQHRKVKAGLSILLTDHTHPYFRDFLFPVGNLREWRSGKKRADIIVVTKCPKSIKESEKAEFIRKISPASHQNVFFTYLKYSSLLSLSDGTPFRTNQNQSALLVTGIASPGMLYAYLKQNFKKLDHISYDDHHEYSDGDFEKIRGSFLNLPGASKIIITTEKDAMRMSNPGFAGLPIYYLPIEIGFIDREEEFNRRVKNFVSGKNVQ